MYIDGKGWINAMLLAGQRRYIDQSLKLQGCNQDPKELMHNAYVYDKNGKARWQDVQG